MTCELCGGPVTWRGPLSALTHTECEQCGGRNCQKADVQAEEDKPIQEMIVGHSIMRGGWCVYTQAENAEYDVLHGPFQSKEEAETALNLAGGSHD